jgi:hypothetical protein
MYVLTLSGPLMAAGPAAAAPSASAAKPAPPGSGAAPTAGKPQSSAAAGGDLVAKAQGLFDDQQYEESIQTLSAALVRPSNTKAQKVEIYRLLSLNYITLNRKDEAESAVRGLLSIQPDYQLPANESPRFRDFFTAVRAKWEGEGRPGLVKEDVNLPKVTIRHGAPTQADPNTSIDLVARIEDPGSRVSEVRVRYRTGSHDDFQELTAEFSDGRARVQLPAAAVKPPIVEYYIEALDKTGNVVGSRGDSGTPIRIAVSEPQKGWVVPVAIGGGVLGVGAIIGGLALAGVFKGSSSTNPGGGTKPGNQPGQATVTIGIASFR